MKKLIFFLTLLFFKASVTFASYEDGITYDGSNQKSVALYLVIVVGIVFILALSLRGKKKDKENGNES